mmetsp:Transcript_55675/g.162805  ORF Transcript_55675/g.162805 Transcript_55675/m.162805 type:complete len:84 (-) Transcript_55675:996-1247(-)
MLALPARTVKMVLGNTCSPTKQELRSTVALPASLHSRIILHVLLDAALFILAVDLSFLGLSSMLCLFGFRLFSVLGIFFQLAI